LGRASGNLGSSRSKPTYNGLVEIDLLESERQFATLDPGCSWKRQCRSLEYFCSQTMPVVQHRAPFNANFFPGERMDRMMAKKTPRFFFRNLSSCTPSNRPRQMITAGRGKIINYFVNPVLNWDGLPMIVPYTTAKGAV